MSFRPFSDLIETLRASLKKQEDSSGRSQVGPALAEPKSTLRLRIRTLEVALRQATEFGPSSNSNKIPGDPGKKP